MQSITNFITNINICYFLLIILLFIDLYFYLTRKNLDKLKKRIILLGTLILNIFIFHYLNSIFNSIFELKYLSVKSYLLMLAITNIITLITINKKTRISYATLNYTLFILMTLIFGSVIMITIGNIFSQFYIMDISNVVTLIDLSFVIFILYLIGMSLIYISENLIFNKKNHEIKETSPFNRKKINLPSFTKPSFSWIKRKTSNKEEKITNILTPEELLNYPNKTNFYINGVECSIIFEDSNQENIVKNYQILLENIDAKMVNGFTLKENQLLKSICTKLQVGNLNHIDLTNTNLLNRVSIEEYNFLKKII